jgi:antitoxin component of RelBE/YafQ-DinJ toxin-antitoxin module
MANEPACRKSKKTDFIGARCTSKLKEAVESEAAKQGLDPSDIVRIACNYYIQRIGIESTSISPVLIQ